MIQDLFSVSVLLGVAYSAIRLATPYLYAALGETIGQRSGVLNLGVDGIMLMGAFMGYYAVYLTGNPWLGVLVALITGALMGLLMAVISVTLQAEQGISGIGLYLFGFGLSSLLLKVLVGTPVAVTGFEPLPIPILSQIPVIGPILFDHNILIYLAYLLVPATAFLINRTNIGLKIRAVGENPQAADSLGVSVHGVRYATVITGSALAGLAGASLSIGLLDIFQENITNGLGFIAVALVYFGNWRPRGVLFGALLFSAVSALQMWIQLTKLPVPSEVAIMLPYALTIIVLALGARQVRQPQALAKPFERGEQPRAVDRMHATPSPNHRTVQHLEMRGITKRFPGVLACDGIDFDVRAGEVHSLLGENGAGKSTLMKILYGLYQPDAGAIIRDGTPVQVPSPTAAIRLGIGMIHQHFMLVDELTVAENVALGLPSSRAPLLNLDRVTARVRDLSATYHLQVDPAAPVWTLAVGERQHVEIIKVLYRGASLLILDEPTAVLTPQEVDDLFVTLRQMTAEGHALIFISHKLKEVLAISDRISVLREGKLAGTVPNQDVTRTQLARLMVGREVILAPNRETIEHGEVRLALHAVSARRDSGQIALDGVSLEVRAGEILGVAGVSGNGQHELAEVVAGLRPVTSGRVEAAGVDVTAWPPGKRTAAGMAYIPEERMRDGVVQEFSVSENLVLQDNGRPPYSNGFFLNFRAIAESGRNLVAAFDVRTPSIDTPTRSLSGGNIQKLILARELARKPGVLVAEQPTRGVDVGAIEYIHQRLLEQRRQGAATLLISEDLDEILALADRIAVLYEGRVMDVVAREEASAERLGLLMAGSQTG